MNSSSTWKPVAISGAIALGLALIPLFFGRIYYGADFFLIDYAYLCEMKRLLATGEHLWISRALGNGEPFYANPQAQLLYPFRWMEALLPVGIGSSMNLVIHWAIGAAGATYLAIRYGVSRGLAILAGPLFLLSGTVLDLAIHCTYILGAAYLPWIWGAARENATSPTRRSRALLAAVAVLCLLGCEPQTYFIGLGILILEGAGWRALATYALAFGASLIQWGPALVEFGASRKNAGIGVNEAIQWAFDWQRLLVTFIPEYLTESSAADSLQVWNPNPYLGILVVSLGFLGVFRRGSRALTVALVGSFIFVLGKNTPVLPFLMEHVPQLRAFRYPAKYFLVTTLAMLILALRMVSAIQSDPGERKFFLRAFGITAAALGLLIVLHSDSGTAAAMIHPGGLLLLAALTLIRDSRWAMLIPALMVFDLAVLAPNEVSTGEDIDSIPTFQAHQPIPGSDGAVWCFTKDIVIAGLPLAGRTSDDSYYVGYKAIGYPNLNACEGIVSGTAYSVLITTAQQEFNAGVNVRNLGAIRALGCTHVISSGDIPGLKQVGVSEIYTEAARKVTDAKVIPPAAYQVSEPIPEAFVARNPARFKTYQELYQSVEAVPVSDNIVHWVEREGELPRGDHIQSVRLARAKNDRLTLIAEGAGAGILGVRIRHALGWKAHQGGKELEITRIAGTFLGVIVPDAAAGPIELEYSPPRLRESIVASIVSLLLLIASVLYRRPRRAPRMEAVEDSALDGRGQHQS